MPVRPICLALAMACAASSLGQQVPVPGATATQDSTPVTQSPANATLTDAIQAILNDPAVSGAQWGIAVTRLDGTMLYGLNEAKLFRPASTAKLFTTAAAMELLGPTATRTTTIRGTLEGDAVTGDLTLVGDGDPTFGTTDVPYTPHPATTAFAVPQLQDLRDLVDQLVARGIHEVRGDIVGDDSRFPYEPYPEGWSTEDLLWGYGAPVSALSIADNELQLVVDPAAHAPDAPGAASPATVRLEQFGVPYYTVRGSVLRDAAPSLANGVSVDIPPGTENVLVSGQLPHGAKAVVEHLAINDPPRFAALALRTLLVQRGIRVTGAVRVAHYPVFFHGSYLNSLRSPDTPAMQGLAEAGVASSCGSPAPSGTVLAEHRSPALAADITYTLKESQNLHAELMLHQLGRVYPCFEGTILAGAQAVRAFLLHNVQLMDGDFTFYDGSGLSTKDLVTPRAEAKLLSYASTQPWFPQWKVALPVGGVDGTLASRFTDPATKGRVLAKTGTLGESRVLAGYVRCVSGQEVVVCIMVDNHQPGSSADRAAMDRIVALIAQQN